MSCRNPQDAELEAILGRFSSFIKMHLLKFNPAKHGLDIDDLIQEVKIKIWKLVDQKKDIINLTSYIKKIVDSTFIDQLRKVKRQDSIYCREKEKKITELKTRYPRFALQENDLRVTIVKALDSLLDSRRKAVQLYLLNLSLEEIAVHNSWSLDKTRNLLYRGLADLREKLRQAGINYED